MLTFSSPIRLDKRTAGLSAADYQVAFRNEIISFIIVGIISFFVRVGFGHGRILAKNRRAGSQV